MDHLPHSHRESLNSRRPPTWAIERRFNFYFTFFPWRFKYQNFRFTPLHDAINRRSLPSVIYWIEKGHPLDTLNPLGWTALHNAVGKGWTHAVAILLQKGANPNLHIHSMHASNSLGQIDLPSVLSGAPWNTKHMDGYHYSVYDREYWTNMSSYPQPHWYRKRLYPPIDKTCFTALHLAIYFCRSDIVHGILKHNSNVNCDSTVLESYGSALWLAVTIQPHHRTLPLALAMQLLRLTGDDTTRQREIVQRKREMINALLNYGANPNSRHPGWTFNFTDGSGSLLACAISADDQITVNSLLQHGAEATAGIIHQACSGRGVRPCERLIAAFLERGGNPEAMDCCDFNCLHHAVVAGDEAAVTLLLDRGMDPNAKTQTAANALHLAAGVGTLVSSNGIRDLPLPETPRFEIPELAMIEMGCIVGPEDFSPPEIQAAEANAYLSILDLLLGRGGELNQTDDNGLTPLQWALNTGFDDGVKLLLGRGADLHLRNDETSEAAAGVPWVVVTWPVFKVLLAYDFSLLNGVDSNGATLLRCAAYRHDITAVRGLLDLGADPGADWQWRKVSWPVFKTLLAHDHGFRDMLDNSGTTYLHYAAARDDVTAVRELLDHGADPDIKTRGGDTALYIALCLRRLRAFATLVDSGVNIEANVFERLSRFPEFEFIARFLQEDTGVDSGVGGLLPLVEDFLARQAAWQRLEELRQAEMTAPRSRSPSVYSGDFY